MSSWFDMYWAAIVGMKRSQALYQKLASLQLYKKGILRFDWNPPGNTKRQNVNISGAVPKLSNAVKLYFYLLFL